MGESILRIHREEYRSNLEGIDRKLFVKQDSFSDKHLHSRLNVLLISSYRR